MRISLLISVFLQITCIQAEAPRTYAPETPERSARGIAASFDMIGTLMPHWSGQALIGVQDNRSSSPLVYTIDRNGQRDSFPFAFPDGATINVYGLAINPDGTVAVAGGAVSGDARGGSFLALVAADRKHQTIVRTWPYVARQVVFVPDGSLWTVGYVFHDTEDRIVKPNIMSHFDSSGKLLESFPVTAKARFGAGRTAANASFLRTSSDRMGWFTNGMEYIEFSFDGREIGRYDGPEVAQPVDIFASFALSDNNEVLFGKILDSKRRTWSLDRENRHWIPVQLQDESLPAWGNLLGFDGRTLVVTGKLHEMRRYKAPIRASAQ